MSTDNDMYVIVQLRKQVIIDTKIAKVSVQLCIREK